MLIGKLTDISQRNFILTKKKSKGGGGMLEIIILMTIVAIAGFVTGFIKTKKHLPAN